MTTPADRIRWLAKYSAERRALREQGAPAAWAIWLQTTAPDTARYSVTIPKNARVNRPSAKVRRFIVDGLIQVQDGRCYICIAAGVSRGLARFGDGDLRPVLEHVHPVSRGGKNWNNVAAAHTKCDKTKGNRLPTRAELYALAQINAGVAPQPPPSSMSG